MNVSFLIILVLDVISIVTQTEASRRWWSGKSKHKHWNWDRSAKTPICSVGQCVLAWKCPDDAILTEATGSCPYWTDGPWLCCDLSNEHNQKPEINFEARPSFPDYKQEVTNSWKKKSTTEGYWNNDKKHFTTQDPWKRGAREEPTPITAADDILRNAPGRPVYNPTQTPRPGVRRTTEDTRSRRTTPPSSIIRTTRNKTPTADSRIVFPTHGWQQKVTKRPDFNTQKPKRVTTPDYKPTTKTWSQPTRSTTKAAFQPSTRQPGRTVSAGTRRPAAPTRTWVAGSDERKNDGRATSTPAYPTRRPTVPTRAWAAGSDERRNDGRATSTPAYPNQGRTTRTPNRPNTARTTARTTRRNRITTPLPNVNTHMCGIRDQSPPRNRQGRSSNLEYVEFIHSDSRSREGRKPYQRIVGGEEAEPFSWPWVAALYKVASSGGHRFLSAGSLINEHFVLTAAHVFTPDDLKTASFVVMLGTHDAQDAVAEYLVASVVQHPNYEHRYYYNDIALLRLVKPVIFNDYVMPVCLPSPDAPLLRDRDLEGKRVTVMGWGDESFGGKSSRVLKEATFPIVSRTSCNASYVRVASNRFPRGITAEMLCAGDPNGGKDACQGDSGGPLTSIERGRYTQVGIVSFGYQCGDKEFPGVYTKVAPYLSWIAENTQSTEDYMNDYHYDYGG